MSMLVIATRRISSGVPGLDEVLQGGLPREALLLVEGPPGSGKTTLGMQFLLQGVRDGETCLLASNAETLEQLKLIAASHAWNLDGIHIAEFTEPAATDDDDGSGYTLFPEAEVELGETLQHLFAEIERIRPTLLVLDTISVLRVLAPTPAFYRRQLRRIRDFVLAHSCTTLMLDEGSRTDDKDARSQTLADGIVELHQLDFKYGADRRQLRVRKLRGCSYFSGAHDFTIVTGGLTVYPRLVARTHAETPTLEPLSSGVAQIDALLGGGLSRGSSTLVMGPAGTGKSTISTVYAMAAAERGERCSILLFDESVESHIARSQGLGLNIAPAIEAGRIRVNDLDPAELSAGQIAGLLVRQVEVDKVGVVVIDTVNGYLQSAAEEQAVFLHLRELISYLRRRRVVTLLTLTEHGILVSDRSTPIDVSFLADNVLLLRYFEAKGAIHQALSVVKKRSGQHERTIRELTLKPGSIALGEPLEDFTGVLTGAPNYARG
jgi:circadian clock protein KaiC